MHVPTNWRRADWLPNHMSPITWVIYAVCLMFCNVIIVSKTNSYLHAHFWEFCKCDHAGYGVGSFALVARILDARQHGLSLFLNKTGWSIVLYSLSLLSSSFCNLQYCFTWQSIVSLFEALFRLFILDIPSGKAKKVLWFRSCSCSFDASKRLVCPIGHNGFPLIVMMNLRRFLEVRRKSVLS